jgi:hypothetical protein
MSKVPHCVPPYVSVRVAAGQRTTMRVFRPLSILSSRNSEHEPLPITAASSLRNATNNDGNGYGSS